MTKSPQASILAKNIKALRRKHGLTQESLAEKSGLSVVAIKQVEGGKRWPREKTLDAIAKAFSVNRSSLMSDPQNENAQITMAMETIVKAYQASQPKRHVLPQDILDALETADQTKIDHVRMILGILDTKSQTKAGRRKL